MSAGEETRHSPGPEFGDERAIVDDSRVVDAYQPDEVSLVQLLNVLLRHRYRILGVTFGVAFLVVLVTLLLSRDYTASASFTPQVSEPSTSRLASLAGQFGVNIPTGESGQSPQLYADLLESREILKQVVVEPFEFWERESEDDSTRVQGTLVDLMEIMENKPPDVRRVEAIEWLREEAIRVSTDQQTGVVELEVTTKYAGLSFEITRRLVNLVNEFNLETRQSQAMAERTFVEERVGVARASLRSAEDQLKRFLQNNRDFSNSPELQFEYDRLQREVVMQQQVYTSLLEAYEQARIAEVRNTPVITVIEPPERPVRPDRRWLLLKALFGLILGGLLGVFLAFGREYVQRTREEGEEEIREFDELWGKTKEDLRTLGGRLRRTRTSST